MHLRTSVLAASAVLLLAATLSAGGKPRAAEPAKASAPQAPAASASAPAAAPAKAAPSPAAPAASTPAPAAAKPSGLKSLPDFTLPDLEGKPHASKDWKGRVVLVDFWATWCAGCRETIPALSRLQEKYKAQGLSVVGVSLDKGPKSKVSKFAKKMKMDYQVLLDGEDSLSKVFGFEGIPSLYLFDRQGNLVKAMAGYTAVQDKELEGLVAAQFKGAP
jgi:thiol-disulfide isomerase/thioredoxin